MCRSVVAPQVFSIVVQNFARFTTFIIDKFRSPHSILLSVPCLDVGMLWLIVGLSVANGWVKSVVGALVVLFDLL